MKNSCLQKSSIKEFFPVTWFSLFSYIFLNPKIWILKRIRSEKPSEISYRSILLQKLFWPFTVPIGKLFHRSSDLKNVSNSWPSASNFKSFSWLLKHFFLTDGQNNFGNKIPLLSLKRKLRTLLLNKRPRIRIRKDIELCKKIRNCLFVVRPYCKVQS